MENWRIHPHRPIPRLHLICSVAAISAGIFCTAELSLAQLPAFGTTSAHDPSTLTEFAPGDFVYFCTGWGIPSRYSTDMIHWNAGAPVFSTPPAWTTTAVPGAGNDFWAPDVSYFDGEYHLYYAVSTFGSQTSAIGMATTPTLNPSENDFQWTDHGPVIQSNTSSPYNTIDPSILQNTDGTLWMSFGSYWNGIYVTQLDPSTGLRKPNTSPVQIADNSSIEASYLYQHNGYYYLFVNFGQCCMGVNSTYNIRVGRSTSITGPFLDENNKPMLHGGGTLLLGSEGKYIGPGQVGILDDNNQYWMSYHYYDGTNNGAPTYALEQLYWTVNNWPTLTPVPEPAVCLAAGAVFLYPRRRRSGLTTRR